MKKHYQQFTSIIVLVVLTLALSKPAHSQTHKIYFGTGYNIPTTTSVIGSFSTRESIRQNISTFAKSVNYGIGYQYTVTNNLIMDLNISYMPGLTDEKFIVDDNWIVGYNYYTLYSTSNVAISPDVQVQFTAGIFSPYLKLGCSINFIKLDLKYFSNFGNNNPYQTNSYKSNFSLGLVSGIGTNIIISKTFIGFAEVQLNSQTYYPDKVAITATGSNTTTEYKLKETIHTGSDEFIKLKQSFPYSSLGIIIGLRVVI